MQESIEAKHSPFARQRSFSIFSVDVIVEKRKENLVAHRILQHDKECRFLKALISISHTTPLLQDFQVWHTSKNI